MFRNVKFCLNYSFGQSRIKSPRASRKGATKNKDKASSRLVTLLRNDVTSLNQHRNDRSCKFHSVDYYIYTNTWYVIFEM